MRYVHVSSSCGCAMPGLAALADAEVTLAKAARQGRAAGRRKPQTTELGRYVERRTRALAPKLRRALQAAGKRTAKDAASAYARLAKDDGSKSVLDSILAELSFDDLGLTISGELAGPMLAAFRRAAALGATQVGFDADSIVAQVDPLAVAYAEARGGALIKDFAGTTRDAVSTVIGRAVDGGWSVDMLQEAIEGMGAFGEARARTIARTELAFAHTQGNVAAWKETGEVMGSRWVLADTHPDPDICDQAAEAGVIELDAEFAPGIKYPPGHPNCLCVCIPILKPDTSN